MTADRPAGQRRPGPRHVLLDLLRRDLTRLPHRTAPPGTATLADLAAVAGRPLRVAVARLDGLGDWVLTLPLVPALLADPHVEGVTLVAPPGLRPLLDRHAGAAFLGLPLPTRIRPPRPGGTLGVLRSCSRWAQDAALADGARHRGAHDVVLVPRFDVDRGFNLVPWALGAQALVVAHDPRGQRLATAQERREAALLAVAVQVPAAPAHELDRLRSLLAVLGLPTQVPPAYGAAFFGVPPGGDPAGPVVLHTGALEAKRRWPPERWRALAERVLRDGGRVALVGGPEDAATARAVAAGLGPDVEVRAGAPLAQLPALLASARALVGGDSGPAHLAASLGVPTVVVSAHPADGLADHGNSPLRFGPVGERSQVLQPPRALAPCRGWCSADAPHCIAQIPVEDVHAALVRLTGEGSALRPA